MPPDDNTCSPDTLAEKSYCQGNAPERSATRWKYLSSCVFLLCPSVPALLVPQLPETLLLSHHKYIAEGKPVFCIFIVYLKQTNIYELRLKFQNLAETIFHPNSHSQYSSPVMITCAGSFLLVFHRTLFCGIFSNCKSRCQDLTKSQYN